MTGLFLEDFAVGQVYLSGETTVNADNIRSFASEFDPQPFHLDETAAQASLFKGLAASGWHTAAMTMRLLVESGLRPAGGLIGAGGDEIRWPRPTRPGDTLRCVSEILEVRASAKRSDQGIVKIKTTTTNAAGAAVQIVVMNIIVRRRPPAAPDG